MIITYFINGFLESGKTTFIKNIFAQKEFQTDETTLLLLCEEGEEEYELEFLESKNVHVAYIENQEDFNPEYITNIEKTVRPKRIIVEFNGMWNRKDIQFPWYWDKPVEIALFNAETFEIYSMFYLDAMENVERYIGKTVQLKAMVIKKAADKPETVIVGRYAMTCCAEDLSLFGFVCDYDDTVLLDEDDWIDIEAIVEKDYIEKYDLYYPVLNIASLNKCEEPEKEIVEV